MVIIEDKTKVKYIEKYQAQHAKMEMQKIQRPVKLGAKQSDGQCPDSFNSVGPGHHLVK